MNDFSYDLIKKGLSVSALRQKAISSNIANVNTPNYKVNRVEFEKLLSEASNGLNMKKTDSMHFGAENVKDIEPVMEKREGTSMRDDGNNVDIDLEMTELAANDIYYNVLIQLLNTKLSKMNYVINR